MRNRVIENWLTKANEISYQIPFCQLLISKGYKILHTSRHGPFEQGKDIIATDPKGMPCCFQLKSGNITLSVWRRIRSEIEELVELKAIHPSFSKQKAHDSYLVTNGELADEVRREIDDRNKEYKKKGYRPIRTIVKGELLSDFQKYYGDFLPLDVPELNTFLNLYQDDGRSPLDKTKLVELLEKILFDELRSKKAQEQAINSVVVIISNVLGNKYLSENHIAIIDGLVLLLSYIFALTEKNSLPKKYWQQTVDLIISGIENAFLRLIEEIKSRKHFVEGDALADVAVYKARISMLAGYLSAFGLYQHIKKVEKSNKDDIKDFLEQTTHKLVLLGESMTPFIINTALFRQVIGDDDHSRILFLLLLNSILKANEPFKGKGLPDPYHNIEELLRLHLGLIKDIPDETFENVSYSLKTIVLLLSKMGLRTELESCWRLISYISYAEFVPKANWQMLIWWNKDGELKCRFPNAKQRWQNLVKESQEDNSKFIPKILRENPALIPIFLNVYPHRMRSVLVLFLTDNL